MSAPQRGKSGSRFIFSILLPVIVAVAATFGVVGGLINYSTTESDKHAIARETSLVASKLVHIRDDLRHQQADVAGWDDAVAAVTGNIDLEWIHEYLGHELYESFGHDRTFLLNPSLEPVYAMQNGESIDAASYEGYARTFAPFLTRLREIDWQGALSAYSSGSSNVIPSIGDVILLQDGPAMVNFMPLASDSRQFEYRLGGEYIHVTIQYLDNVLAAELGEILQIKDARFSATNTVSSHETFQPFRNRAGFQLVAFAWQPDQPGASILKSTAPAIIAAMIIVIIVITALMFGLNRSTSQLEDGRSTAQYMAFHDKLTGLANRALFEDRLGLAVARAKRGAGDIALLILDLDRFKQVNDTLGHEAGDHLIQQVAERLRPLLRESDTIARLGGDEFAVILMDFKSPEDMTMIANRIIRSIEQPFEVGGSQAFVGVSIGIAVSPSVSSEPQDLTRKADIALYQAKAGGRNQFKVFEANMSEAVLRRQLIESELRLALKAGEGLEVEFQPLVAADTSAIVGVEAAINWKNDKLGNLALEEFIPVAESCGLIEPLGDFMLQQACATGAKTPGQRVAIHLYAAQLRNPTFFTKVMGLLGETGMAAGDLEMLINEKLLSTTDPTVVNALRMFRKAGINIALSDFGTGFTSLRLLQQFQVDRIRIDRSFIAQLAESPDPEAITHAVVWLARAIGVEVSADGVDTVEQKQFLSRMGCMSFQGDLFSSQGQAAWLRTAAKIAPPTAERTAPQDDIELWEVG